MTETIDRTMGIKADEIAQEAIKAIADRIKNLKTLNIIVAGKTGAGKSTLINAVFRERMAETGIGKPVTDHMRKITKQGIPLTIYDTRGFELDKGVQTNVKQEIVKTIKAGLSTKDINQTIHCIWYCINTASNRIEPTEIEWLRKLSEDDCATQTPIIVVLTQSFSKKKAEEMKKQLMDENLNVKQVIPVLAEDYEIDEDYTSKAFGLDTLIQVMGQVLPKELSDTLQNVQIASLAEKRRNAQIVVTSCMLSATGEGAIPIPCSDCFLLVPTQIGMITAITVIYGFEVNKSLMMAFLSSTVGSGGATILGKTVVSNILKLIPGAGSVIGGVISAGTAGTITAALGEAYIGVMELIARGEMNMQDLASSEGKKKFASLFKSELKKRKT